MSFHYVRKLAYPRLGGRPQALSKSGDVDSTRARESDRVGMFYSSKSFGIIEKNVNA
jgi:hypothetical protein